MSSHKLVELIDNLIKTAISVDSFKLTWLCIKTPLDFWSQLSSTQRAVWKTVKVEMDDVRDLFIKQLNDLAIDTVQPDQNG